MASINSVSTVPYVPQAATTSQHAAPDSAKADATAAPALDARPPQLAAATAAALIAEQAAPPAAPADLAGQDLRNTDLTKLDLKNANLKGANLSGMDLSGLDFSGADLSGANLSGATLNNANLSGVHAQGANFSGATMTDTAMNDANFEKAAFSKVTMRSSDLHNFDIVGKLNVTLDGADFTGASLTYIAFKGGTSRNATFNDAQAERVTFIRSDVSGSKFQNISGSLGVEFSTAENLDFRNASGSATIHLTASKIDGTTFQGGSYKALWLRYSDLREVNLDGAYVANADLASVNFSGATMRGAYFVRADVASNPTADVTGANLESATGAGAPVVDFMQRINAAKKAAEAKEAAAAAKSDAPAAATLPLTEATADTTNLDVALKMLNSISDQLSADQEDSAKKADAKKAAQDREDQRATDEAHGKGQATQAKIDEKLLAGKLVAGGA